MEKPTILKVTRGVSVRRVKFVDVALNQPLYSVHEYDVNKYDQELEKAASSCMCAIT